MNKYLVYFDIDGLVFKLPVNPEEIVETTAMAVEKYEILKLGQIAVPTHMELREFSFETELPRVETHYSTAGDDFINSTAFLNRLKTIRENFTPVRFVYGMDMDESDKISESEGESLLVLIEELEIAEKAGEEGDKYVSFKLIEYREYGKKSQVVEEITSLSISKSKAKKKKSAKETSSPKSNGYHIVAPGDTLWSIAKKYYGDGSKSNIIFNANKDKVKKPALISIGWKLKIPTKDEFSKYSAPLPKTIKVEPAIKKFTLPGEEIIAGFGVGW